MKNSRCFFILKFTILFIFLFNNNINAGAKEGNINTIITPFSIIGKDERSEVENSEKNPTHLFLSYTLLTQSVQERLLTMIRF